MDGDRWLAAWGVGSAAFGAVSVLAPLYAVTLGAGPEALGVLAAVAALAGAPGAVVVGRYADRTGRRRPVVLGGLLLAALALGLMPFPGTVAAVIALNGVVWFASAAVAPVVTMLVVDLAAESEWTRRIGTLNAYQGWGWAIGLLGGALWTGAGSLVGVRFAQEVLFGATALLTLVAAGLSAYWLPPDEPTELTPSAARRLTRTVFEGQGGFRMGYLALAPTRLYWATRAMSPRELARRFSPALAAYYGAAALFLTGFQVFWAPLPAFLTEAGFGSGAVFALYLVGSLASALLYTRVGEASSRRDPRLLQAGALGVRALAFPVVAVVTGLFAAALGFAALALLLALVGMTWAVIAVTATALVTALAPNQLRGEALGIYVALTSVAGGVGSVLGGWLGARSYLLAFGVAGGLVAVAALLVALGRR